MRKIPALIACRWSQIFTPSRRACFVSVLLLAIMGVVAQAAQLSEFRGFWVDSWSSDLWTSQGISQVVGDIRAGNMNAVIPQIRRRGDALYNSNFEPKCHNISGAFDPLADLIVRAHNTNNGPRVEVHAWVVTYHVWTASATYPLPPQASHVVNLHPDWLLKNKAGETLIDSQYTLDPGHPAVQEHTFNVCMDLIRNYDIDGLNFDYIRYSGTDEGYNDVSVARFKRLYKRTSTPAPEDTQWKQFRREQITALLRKVYLHAIDEKPWIKISCDTITWSPAPTSLASWYSSSAAWNNVLQDWRGWMQEGIMDMSIPMNYFRHEVSSYATAYTNWSNFAKNNRYDRHTVIGPGIYLNSIADGILQMRQTRQATSSGLSANGVVGYSYRVTNEEGLPRADFLNALVSKTSHDPQSVPIFAEPVSVPEMTWKTQPTKGHIKGFVRGGATALDGAIMALSGPASRAQTNDATGFYGFANLAPGTYTVRASFPEYSPMTNIVEVVAGKVSTLDFAMQQPPPMFQGVGLVEPGKILLRASGAPGSYGIDWTPDMTHWHSLTNVTSTSNTFEVLDSSATNNERFYRARRLQ